MSWGDNEMRTALILQASRVCAYSAGIGAVTNHHCCVVCVQSRFTEMHMKIQRWDIVIIMNVAQV